jgi:hypothetical protein
MPTHEKGDPLLPTASANRVPLSDNPSRPIVPNVSNITTTQKNGLLPTPQSSDNRDRGNPSNPAIQRRAAMGKQLNLSMVVNSDSLTGQETGAKLRLSPAFVEWMMGYPEGWLDFPMEAQSPKADGDRKPSSATETP